MALPFSFMLLLTRSALALFVQFVAKVFGGRLSQIFTVAEKQVITLEPSPISTEWGREEGNRRQAGLFAFFSTSRMNVSF